MLPFDLHVLSMPPAFNLSQDQTLQFIAFIVDAALATSSFNPYSIFKLPQKVTYQSIGLPQLSSRLTFINVSAHTYCLVFFLKSYSANLFTESHQLIRQQRSAFYSLRFFCQLHFFKNLKYFFRKRSITSLSLTNFMVCMGKYI